MKGRGASWPARPAAVRRITARRLTESATAPHFYLTSVIDAGRLLAFRAEINFAVPLG